MKKIFVVFLILLVSCKNESLINGKWKHQDGYRIADWLDFEENVEVRNDTVFQNSKPIAKFINVRVAFFGIPAKLEIADLKTNETGVYVGK